MGIGMNRATGRPLTDEAQDIVQSVQTLITTPIETRIRRRGVGGRVIDLIDSPGTEAGALRLIAAAADVVARWERRVRFLSGTLTPGYDGAAMLSMDLAVRADARPLSVNVPLVLARGAP